MCPGGGTKNDREPTIVASSLYRAHSATMASPALLSAPNPTKPGSGSRDIDETETCRHCGSHSLLIDWRQGDKVCTDCGVVAEERLRDDRPEWREFSEAEDLAKGAAASARCGMVPVDESRYLGGLQPTSLTKAPFGGQSGPSGFNESNGSAARVAMIRKRLLSTNRKLDRMIGQSHARALKNARVSRLVRKRQLLDGEVTDQSDLDSVMTADDDVRPELEQLLIQEEEDVNRMQGALNADKWSLRRAILLHGNHESLDNPAAALTERDELQTRLDSKLRKASADLYTAYHMLLDSSRRLQLPDRVMNEACDMMCRYVARRDGFAVRGVSSRLAMKKTNVSAAQQKQAAASLREHNKMRQMGSLCAALLLLTARKLGWPRALQEVCASVQPPPTPNRKSGNDSSFIKAKHCSRAMDEIKMAFPDFARSVAVVSISASTASSANDFSSTCNFVDHSVRKLSLPPVAEASIRALVWHCAQEQKASGQSSGTKLSTLCAATAYFVCLSGSVMQQLASQAQTREKNKDTRKRKSNFTFQTKNSMAPPPPKVPRIIQTTQNTAVALSTDAATTAIKSNEADFDVFSHHVGSELLVQKKEYEMRRVWDTWAEQTAWLRSLAEIEQASGVSSNMIKTYYKANLIPRRLALLEYLKDAVATTGTAGGNAIANNPEASTNMLSGTPLASVLLSHMAAAAPLLNSNLE